MKKSQWLKWFLFFVIALLTLEVLKSIVSKINISASYLISIILLSLQSLVAFGFIYYAVIAIFFKKRLSKKRFILFFTTSFFGLMAIAEILFTYLLYHPVNIPDGLKPAYKYYYEVYNFHLMQYEKKLISFDNELLYTLKPEVSGSFFNAEFNTQVTTNKVGVRDDEESLKSPEIICIGDSFTMGWGVEKDQSFPEIIERKTGKKVLNAGIPSYGTARETLLLNRLDTSALKYIILQYCSNDMEENNSFAEHDFKLNLTSFQEYASAMRSYELSRKYFPGKNFLLVTQLWFKQAINKIYPLFKLNGQQYTGKFNSQEHIASFLKVFERFSEKFKNVKIIVTDLEPYVYHKNEFIEELNQLQQKTGEMKNVIFINTLEELTPADYFILDHHINALGHQRIAEKLLQVIKN